MAAAMPWLAAANVLCLPITVHLSGLHFMGADYITGAKIRRPGASNAGPIL